MLNAEVTLLWLAALPLLVTSLYEGSPGLDCLVGQQRCLNNHACRSLMQESHENCGGRLDICVSHSRRSCQTSLTMLQNTAHFKNCVCRPPDSDRCNHSRNFLFRHPCLLPEGVAVITDLPTTSTVAETPSTTTRAADPDLNPDADVNIAVIDTHLSCIGERKACVNDEDCEGVLDMFVNYCLEDKESHMCTAPNVQACHDTAVQLKNHQPGIFNCNCNVRRPTARERCERIRDKISNNICNQGAFRSTESPPWFPPTSTPPTSNKAPVTSTRLPHIEVADRSCYLASKACNRDPTCNRLLHEYVGACEWNVETVSCNKDQCLQAIRKFYLLVRAELAHALIFCRCEARDVACTSVQRLVWPTCAVTEARAPACHELINRCDDNNDCRARLRNYERGCESSGSEVCNHGAQRCRNAKVHIMGTILMTNCTCDEVRPRQAGVCRRASRRLRNVDGCKGYADRTYRFRWTLQDRDWGTITNASDDLGRYNDCKNRLAHSLPSYYPSPAVIRKYVNDSECSHVCYCIGNGSDVCRVLPCSPPLSCFINGQKYVHGSLFEHGNQGPCRCIKSEPVCAMSEANYEPVVPGLYIHVGLSLADKNLIQSNAPLRVNAEQVTRNLATLLNGDSAAQFCSVKRQEDNERNIIIKVEVSEYMRADGHVLEVQYERCLRQAKTLVHMINRRDYSIITDAELSVIKVAALQGEEFHAPLIDTISTPLSAYASLDELPNAAVSWQPATSLVICVTIAAMTH